MDNDTFIYISYYIEGFHLESYETWIDRYHIKPKNKKLGIHPTYRVVDLIEGLEYEIKNKPITVMDICNAMGNIPKETLRFVDYLDIIKSPKRD